MKKLLGRTNDYLSLVRFSHTVFAMPFALAGYFIGATGAGLRIFTEDLFACSCLHGLCTECGHGIQPVGRFPHFDALNPRTAVREIPQGRFRAVRRLSLS
jgi:4-hydroxybenzoate polyprenyltransferase